MLRHSEERLSVAVGQILDKYEVRERVGHGGMAVVYRGFDRALKRDVAIKVLHKHLADYPEARERFAREAHAVAKLRHSNILEIYDFAGVEAPESYIVTEFIDGPTLTEFIAEHPPRYPEIGAMVATQLCRALSHAHSLGILHRDIKPENIMIRADGILKLTDFGIAQMLDMQRMTVTGQLLGSPAYMAPEHLDGSQLDFRTDIFAVGVLLYQLVVGALPFQGRNPHEILKRISEGRYPDPRQENPLVGHQLGTIIDTAMARDKAERYSDITEMLGALERYLGDCGIRDCQRELMRYFAAPMSYELALRERLLAALCERGRDLIETDQVAALDFLNRALTLDPEHRGSLALIEALSRRRRTRRALALVAGALALAGVVTAGATLMWSAATDDDNPTVAGGADAPAQRLGDAPQPSDPPLYAARSGDDVGPGALRRGPAVDLPDGHNADAAAPLAEVLDAGLSALVAPASDANLKPLASRQPSATPQRPRRSPPSRPDQRPALDPPDAGLIAVPETPALVRTYHVNVSPRRFEYRVGEQGPFRQVANGRVRVELGPGAHKIEVRNPACCESERIAIGADDPGERDLAVTLGYLPATIKPTCDRPGVSVQIDGRSARLGHKHTILFESSLGQRSVPVIFFDRQATAQRIVQVQYNQAKVVTCDFP